jgi:cell division protein FtsZ
MERQKKSLMERLTTAGFGRRLEGGEMPQVPRQVAMEPVAYAQAPSAQQEQPRFQPVAQQVPRAAAIQPRMFEDDQMEIPAFLRRQSN